MSLCANDPCIQDVDVKPPITWNVPWTKRVKHHFKGYAKQHATFKHPATVIVAGSSGSGKTSFLMSLIEPSQPSHLNPVESSFVTSSFSPLMKSC